MKYIPSERIEQQAMQLLQSTDALTAPVPVDVIAHRIGLTVQYAVLGDDVSGLLVMEDGGAVIGVNKEHPTVRQRFTIAHELGHYMLHRGSSELFIDKKYSAIFRDTRSSSGEDRMEIQANLFAAAILMPSTLLEEEIEKNEIDLGNDYALESLAQRFGVSVQALAYRLSSLGFFERNQDIR